MDLLTNIFRALVKNFKLEIIDKLYVKEKITFSSLK